MRIGVVKELSPDEGRVSLTPHAVHELARAGHRVTVEAGAGEESSLSDEAYREAGAVVVRGAADAYENSELMVKVYGPTPEERVYLKESSILLSFLSLPVNPDLMRALLDSRCVAFAAESIRDEKGRLPALTPMSEIAGRLVPQIGAHYLQRQSGGRGILLGGAVGVRPGRAVIVGGGIVGAAAARVASGLGAEVVVIDRDLDRLRALEGGRLRNVTTLSSSRLAIQEAALEADLLIGAVLVVSSRTPALVAEETVEGMKEGAVIVDVDVDEGGCVETSRPTTLSDPVFTKHGVTHYCVKNVPASVPVTSTRALSNALLPYVRKLSGLGLRDSLNSDAGLSRGVAVADGRVVDPILAREAGMEYNSISSVLPLGAEMV